MTHRQCIAILLGAGPGRRGGRGTTAGSRAEAEEHASRCSDCWAVLDLLHELATGAPSPDAGRMAALYGCGPVQDRLYLLAGMTAAGMHAAHPELARHLGWCHACRDRLAEVAAVERAAAGAVLGVALGERIHEAVGRLVVHVRRAAAAFTAVPEGFAVAPLPALAGASRAGAPAPAESGPAPLGQEVRFRLPGSSVSAELRLEARGDRVGLALRFSGEALTGLSVQLRQVRAERVEVVARHTVRGREPVLVEGLRAGQYLLEIHERPQARRFRVRFDVEPAG